MEAVLAVAQKENIPEHPAEIIKDPMILELSEDGVIKRRLIMINAKNFLEFFERECNVQFIDQSTGKRALDIITENEKQKDYPYNHPLYKSDYDKYLESEEGKNIL